VPGAGSGILRTPSQLLMKSADPFGGYIRGLCSLVGARGASVYVPSPPGPAAGAMLSHEGKGPPIPELADLAQAAAFLQSVATDVAGLREAALGLAVVELPTRDPEGRLFGALSPLRGWVPDRRQSGRRPREAGEPAAEGTPVADVWVGFRMGIDDPPLQLPPRAREPRAMPAAWGWLLGFVGELARHGRRVSQILDDPVTGLPGRAEFQVDLERTVENALAKDTPLALLMVNPDGFAAVNERMSREGADGVIREIAGRLQAAHRSSDLVVRYGSLVFASVLVDTDREEGMRRTEEVLERLQERAFVGGQLPLRFSVGLACLEPGDRDVRTPLDLIRRADAALSAAKRAGGGRIRAWQPGADEDAGYVDRLSGIFTGYMSKDYRNMAVLSDTISVLAESAEPQTLAERVVKGLQAAMKPERVGLFEWDETDAPRLVFGVSRRGAGEGAELLVAAEDERTFMEEARRRRRPLERREGANGPDEKLAFAIPLAAGEGVLGVLYLAGTAGSMSVDSSDLVFLEALATQIALALDRARLAERERRLEEQERIRLQAQVEELRAALQRTQILYRSRQMEALLDRVRRVAPTDATVLISGESGTGKEVFARAIHELSRRRDQPFVVVDCGAIPTSLIESELFGHERGAFTGALQKQPGRLVQADRGTLLLDEIGEMPLEAQSRLLRFVQDRYVTPVGGHAGRTVDVRVLAATNRDLLAEVDAGRFRHDLFHRLNVVRLEIPPLRSRPDDVGHLAHHFCRMYSLIYGRPSFSFSPEAEAAVLRHPWPGNVRELQNRVMRAVILGQGTTLTPADLGLAEGGPTPEELEQGIAGLATPVRPSVPVAAPPAPSTAPWVELRAALRRQVEEAVKGPRPVAPLGRWLMEDLVLEADAAADGVASRAADLLRMPVTTFRRQLEAAGGRASAGWSPRPASWPAVRDCLGRLLRHDGTGTRDLLKQVPLVLIEEVLAQVPETPRLGAALLGVSLPTFRRRCEALAAGVPPPREPED
jgi:hydrogenase-4 transcriptional activator